MWVVSPLSKTVLHNNEESVFPSFLAPASVRKRLCAMKRRIAHSVSPSQKVSSPSGVWVIEKRANTTAALLFLLFSFFLWESLPRCSRYFLRESWRLYNNSAALKLELTKTDWISLLSGHKESNLDKSTESLHLLISLSSCSWENSWGVHLTNE